MNNEAIPKIWTKVVETNPYMPVVVKSIERIHDKNWVMDLNSHDHFEFVYVKKGCLVFEIEDAVVELAKNDMLLIKPNTEHKFSVESNEISEFIVLGFTFEQENTHEELKVTINDFINYFSNIQKEQYIKIKAEPGNVIKKAIDNILNENSNRLQLGSKIMQSLLIMQFFILFSRELQSEWENSIKAQSNKSKEIVESSAAYIIKNSDKKLSLADISRQVFLSPTYFAKIFKDNMGISPISYLIKTRVKKAGALLRDTEMKISDIAFEVGFSNQQRFSEMFKRHMGLTPMEHRKKQEN